MLEKVENKLSPCSIPRDLKPADPSEAPLVKNNTSSLLLAKSALICYDGNGKKYTPCSSLHKICKLKISRQVESCFLEVLLFRPDQMSTSNFSIRQEALTLHFCWGRTGPARLAVNNPQSLRNMAQKEESPAIDLERTKESGESSTPAHTSMQKALGSPEKQNNRLTKATNLFYIYLLIH